MKESDFPHAFERPSMSIPLSVQNYLDAQNINYGIEHNPQLMPITHIGNENKPDLACVARLVLLKDELGKVQVIFPKNCLLDISAVNELLGRELRAINNNDLSAFDEDSQLEQTPAIPLLENFPLLADNQLFITDEVFLESGISNTYVKLNQEQFRKTLGNADLAKFSQPIEPILKQLLATDDEQDLATAVKNFTSLRIKSRLDETLEIPPLPDSADRIIKLRVDANATVEDLAKVVEMDPSLAAQVVSWASSPFYSAPGEIRSIEDAIVRVLGFDLVINLALGLALGKTLSLPKDGPQGITPYWDQAVLTAVTMDRLGKLIPAATRPTAGLTYLSGLLNNFGYLILAHIFPPHFSLISRYAEANSHTSSNVIDRHVLGVSREQIGSWLMNMWNLPEEIVTALRWQHTPNYQGEYSQYANLLCVTNQLLSPHLSHYGSQDPLPKELFERLQLDPEEAKLVLENILEKSDDLKAMSKELSKN